MLEATVTTVPDPARPLEARAQHAAESLATYLKACGVRVGEDDIAHLSTLLGATFPELGADRAKVLCRTAFRG
jgi:hypothetical protein